MPTFRFYVLSDYGERSTPIDAFYNSDAEAVLKGRELRGRGCAVEVWSGSRLIEHIEADVQENKPPLA